MEHCPEEYVPAWYIHQRNHKLGITVPNPLKYVTACGPCQDVMFEFNGKVYIDNHCAGTYEEAEAYIMKHYGVAYNFIPKLDHLKAGGEDIATMNWQQRKNLLMITQYFPDHLDPEKFPWHEFSYLVVAYCPHRVVPSKLDWHTLRSNIHNISKYRPELMAYCPEEYKPKTKNQKPNNNHE